MKFIHFVFLCDLDDLDNRLEKFFPTLLGYIIEIWKNYPAECLDATEVFIKSCEMEEEERLHSQLGKFTQEIVVTLLNLLTKKEVLVYKEDILALSIWDALTVYLTICDQSTAKKIILPYLANWTKDDVGIRTSVVYGLASLCRLSLPNLFDVALKAVPMFIGACQNESESKELKVVIYRCLHWIINSYPKLLLEDPDMVILKCCLDSFEKGGEEGSGAGNAIQAFLRWDLPEDSEPAFSQDEMLTTIWNVVRKHFFLQKELKDDLFGSWCASLANEIFTNLIDYMMDDLAEKFCEEFMDIIYTDYSKGFPKGMNGPICIILTSIEPILARKEHPLLSTWVIENLTLVDDKSPATFLDVLFNMTRSLSDSQIKEDNLNKLLPIVLSSLSSHDQDSEDLFYIINKWTDSTCQEATNVMTTHFKEFWGFIYKYVINDNYSLRNRSLILEAVVNVITFHTSLFTSGCDSITDIFNFYVATVDKVENPKDADLEDYERIHGFIIEGWSSLIQNYVVNAGSQSFIYMIKPIFKTMRLSQERPWATEQMILKGLLGLIYDVFSSWPTNDVCAEMEKGDELLLKNVIQVCTSDEDLMHTEQFLLEKIADYMDKVQRVMKQKQ